MEDLNIAAFLKLEITCGGGYDGGYGDGRGDGYGIGDGSGYGGGYGYGSGSGSGDGSGYGIKNLNGENIYLIDGVQTIIRAINSNVAKGFVLQPDMSLKKCYIVKNQNYFAHGETLKEAMQALEEKIIENLDTDELIELFHRHFTDNSKKYPALDFYEWHHKLTGSCEMGRKTFAANHNINIERDTMTVDEFINITENSYGSEIIQRLKKSK